MPLLDNESTMMSDDGFDDCPSTASGMPYDCLILIMKFLPFSTRVVCERVCQEWREASLDCNKCNQLSLCFFAKPRSEVSRKSIQSFCSDASHDISFETDCIFADTDYCPVMIVHVLAKTPNLRALHFKCFEEESLFTDGIDHMSQLCPRIEHLSLSDDTRGCYIYREGLNIVKNCRFLRHLQLRFPAEGTLDFLLENMILKKSLMFHRDCLETLSTNLPLNSENSEVIANECLLTKLSLQQTSATLEGLTMICTSPTLCLKELSICFDWNLQLELISEYMTHLEILKCTIANSEVTNIKCLSSLKLLKSLFLSVWSKESIDEDILCIMKGCSKLESLSINGEVTDASLSQLTQYLPKLQRLEVALNADAKSVSDETLSRGLEGLSNLKHLALNHCNVSEAGVRSLLSNNQKLVFIRVTGAEKLSLSLIPVLEEYASMRPTVGITIVLPKKLVAPLRSESVDASTSNDTSTSDSKSGKKQEPIKTLHRQHSYRRGSYFGYNTTANPNHVVKDERDNNFEEWLQLHTSTPNLYLKFH